MINLRRAHPLVRAQFIIHQKVCASQMIIVRMEKKSASCRRTSLSRPWSRRTRALLSLLSFPPPPNANANIQKAVFPYIHVSKRCICSSALSSFPSCVFWRDFRTATRGGGNLSLCRLFSAFCVNATFLKKIIKDKKKLFHLCHVYRQPTVNRSVKKDHQTLNGTAERVPEFGWTIGKILQTKDRA